MRANNLTLLTDLYELTMMQGYFKNPTDQTVIFDVFYRTNPCDGQLCHLRRAGTDDRLHRKLTFYQRGYRIFSEVFASLTRIFSTYFSNFHFTGDIYAIPEGT